MRVTRLALATLSIVLPAVSVAQVTGGQQSNPDLFTQQILPVLKENCGSCHINNQPAGGLNLQSLDSLLSGGKHGPALTPGDAKQSLLMQYVLGEKTPKMPMGGALPENKIASLTQAINSMQALPKTAKRQNPYLDWVLHKPPMPQVPAVQDAAWVKNPIDAFILAKLESKNLKPAPPASKRALLRRAYFDLIGLPPTPAEIEAFENDTSADAYEKVVDRLLADPAIWRAMGKALARSGTLCGIRWICH